MQCTMGAVGAPGVLACEICYQDYGKAKQPKILPCGHTVCDACLDELLHGHQMGSVRCPTCKRDHPCKDTCIFPVNFALRNIVHGQVLSSRRLCCHTSSHSNSPQHHFADVYIYDSPQVDLNCKCPKKCAICSRSIGI
mmetsp:Transcript_2031/g.6050  ORF Transcript_2031/g.6050 Transcript_2031/m.6050 type:complete len:138 (+) Transcript_2031:563-976(+)